MKKITQIALLFALVFLVFSILSVCFASAVSENMYVISNVSPFAVQNNLNQALHGFNETNEGWDIVKNGGVTLAEKIDTFPYQALSGSGCLIYRNEASVSGDTNIITKKYADRLDLSEYNTVFFGVNCSNLSYDYSYSFTVELKSGNESFKGDCFIDPSCWNGVFFDISSFDKKDKIDQISLSVVYSGAEENSPSVLFEYYIDSIYLSPSLDVKNSFMFSSPSYTVKGGEGSVENGIFNIQSAGDEVTVESGGFAYTNLGNANSLKVVFKSDGLCQNVSLYSSSRRADVYQKESEFAIDSSKDTVTCYLPIDNTEIKNIRLVFEGVTMGNMQILSIQPYSVYVPQNEYFGKVDTCAVNSNTQEIIIRGNIDHSSVESYRNKEIHLFASELCDNVTPEYLAQSKSVLKRTVTTGEFIFRLRYGEFDDSRAYLYKKYTVAVKLESGYVIIGNSKCIANPEGFADKETESPKQRTGKGLYGQSISVMQELDVTDTVIWVDIGKFFATESEKSSKIEKFGNVYYYNAEYIKSLDGLIKNYNEKNIDVTVVLVVSSTGNEGLDKLIIHKDADVSAKYCAFNTADRQGLSYLRTFCEFFGERYCKNDAVKRVVYGDSVVNADRNYNIGQKNLEHFTDEYAKALRVVYNSMKSYSSNVKIYTYIDDIWNSGLPYDCNERYDSKAFLSSLLQCVDDYGDINFGVCQNPYPEEKVGYFSCNDKSLSKEVTAKRVSFANMQIISNYITRDFAKYNGGHRDFIIIERAYFNNIDEEDVTADYIYNSYKALNIGVSSYITNRKCNYNNAMKYIDTSLSLMASHFAPDVLGLSTWESVIEGFSERNILRAQITQSKMTFYNDEIKGSVVLSDFNNGNEGWTRYGFTERVASKMSLLGKTGLMSLSLGNIPANQARGIVKKYNNPIDLSDTPIVSFEINVASLPANENYADIVVIAKSGNDRCEISGRVREEMWTRVYCDFSKFAKKDAIDQIEILICSNEEGFESPQALISAIEGASTEYDSEQLAEMDTPELDGGDALKNIKEYIAVSLIILVLACGCVFVYRRFK